MAYEGVKEHGPEHSNNRAKSIGEGTVVHSHVWIGDDVTIGKNCKIQAFAFIPNGVTIQDNVFIGPAVTFTNDKNPSTNPNWEQSNTIVENGANIGANATILPGITLGAGCTIGAGSVVTKSVPPGETWVGNPARPLTSR